MAARKKNDEQRDAFELLSPAMVAAEFGVRYDLVRWWAKTGRLKSLVTEDGRRFFTRRQVEEFRQRYRRYQRWRASA